MKKVLGSLGLVLLGFALYPGLFVPALVKWFPGAAETWIQIYAHYLRAWGI